MKHLNDGGMNEKTNGKEGMKEAMSDHPALKREAPKAKSESGLGMSGGISHATRYLEKSLGAEHHKVDKGNVKPQ